MSSSVVVVVGDFHSAGENRDPDKFNIFGLPRISDAEHFVRAIDSGTPHSYISARAGRIEYDGEDGLGFHQAVELHTKVISAEQFIIPMDDIKNSLSQNSFYAALQNIGFENLPRHYQVAMKTAPHGRCIRSEIEVKPR